MDDTALNTEETTLTAPLATPPELKTKATERTQNIIQAEYSGQCAELGQSLFQLKGLEAQIDKKEYEIEKTVNKIKSLVLEANKLNEREEKAKATPEAKNVQ